MMSDILIENVYDFSLFYDSSLDLLLLLFILATTYQYYSLDKYLYYLSDKMNFSSVPVMMDINLGLILFSFYYLYRYSGSYYVYYNFSICYYSNTLLFLVYWAYGRYQILCSQIFEEFLSFQTLIVVIMRICSFTANLQIIVSNPLSIPHIIFDYTFLIRYHFVNIRNYSIT